ncbi:hypothetical protein BH10ACI2_BH10ACI2_09640 [soil metagenome]
MSKKSSVDSVEVKNPCTEDWNKMHGNARVRFCDHCAKDVKNLSAVTRKEAMRLVRALDGNICVRYVKDPATGRPLFASHFSRITRVAPTFASGVMTASIALSTAAYAQQPPEKSPNPLPVISSPLEKVERLRADEIKPETTISPRILEDLPISGRTFVTMGLIAIAPQFKYKNELTLAVEGENIEEVRNLVIHGSDVNGKESDKITPLFIAVESGNLEIVRLLLDFGAKTNARDSNKQTPLMRLDEDASPELVNLLITNGSKVDLIDKEGNTALILAAGEVKPEVLGALIEAGADVNLANKDGWTALMNAADNDDLETVKSLLLAGAKVNAKNKDGETALDQASDEKVEELLVRYGAIVKLRPEL